MLSYLPIGTCIYTPGFVLFLLAYWYLYIYAWFCAFLTCLSVLVYIRLVLCYSYLRIGTCIYAWFCAILTCLLVLVYIRLVLCFTYLPIGTCIYTPGFVLFLLAYWYCSSLYTTNASPVYYCPIGLFFNNVAVNFLL